MTNREIELEINRVRINFSERGINYGSNRDKIIIYMITDYLTNKNIEIFVDDIVKGTGLLRREVMAVQYYFERHFPRVGYKFEYENDTFLLQRSF